ncbi:MAG: tail fiber protein [Syntrophomonadaceae bacterium]|nr:tail fiber protein [Syntrophomonadaceae bacterium]
MDPFIGEIRIFAGNFPPKGWAFCDGAVLEIRQYTALFALLGTTYGGDGRTTFALPDLRGKAALHFGAGPGLTPRDLGKAGGTANVQLNVGQMPNHTHVPNCQSTAAQDDPANAIWTTTGRSSPSVYADSPDVAMSQQAVFPTGGGQPHNNMQPYLGVNFIIALTGIFPPHS